MPARPLTNLVHLRTTKGWSQALLAQRSGVSITTISSIEGGRTCFTRASTRRRLAKALRVSQATLEEEPQRYGAL